MISSPVNVGDIVVSEPIRADSMLWRVEEVNPTTVKIRLASDLTPIRDIRKFYKKSSHVIEIEHAKLAAQYSLGWKQVLEAEIKQTQKEWARGMEGLNWN